MHARRIPAAGGRAGFTLLEVVLAMGILVIGMTAVLSMLTFGAALTRSAGLRTAGAGAIEAIVADLEESLFPLEEDGSAGEPREILERPVPGAGELVYSATAVQNPDDPLEYRVDVQVQWLSGGTRRSHDFSTLLLRQVPFGEQMRQRLVEGASGSL